MHIIVYYITKEVLYCVRDFGRIKQQTFHQFCAVHILDFEK